MPRTILPLALATFASLLVGCSTAAGTGAAGAVQPPPQGPIALGPNPGRMREKLLLPKGSDFDFGGGRRVRARDGEPEGDLEAVANDAANDAAAEERASMDPAAFSQPSADKPGALTPEERRRLAGLAPGAVAAHGVRITWEALAVERDLVANPRLGRRPQQGVLPDSKIVLVSDDHPAAIGRQKGRASTREADGSQVAVLGAEDLHLFVRGLREAGFFKVARPTDGVAPHFDDSEARGRVTIEIDGESRTLLSLRGQGTQESTRDVPRLYSQAKQAVATIRNQTPALSVVTTGGQPVKARPRLSTGKSRTLTPEEAAQVLGEEAPPKPMEDDWGLGK